MWSRHVPSARFRRAAAVDGIVLDAGNFGSNGDNSGSGAGRKVQCLVSDASDMANISVTDASGGSAQKVAIKDGSGSVMVEASITSAPVNLGASDAVTLGTFSVILKDPS